MTLKNKKRRKSAPYFILLSFYFPPDDFVAIFVLKDQNRGNNFAGSINYNFQIHFLNRRCIPLAVFLNLNPMPKQLISIRVTNAISSNHLFSKNIMNTT